LDDLKEKRGYWELKEEAPNRTWKIHFRKGKGLAVIQNEENE